MDEVDKIETQYRNSQINNYNVNRYVFLTTAMNRYSLILGVLILLLVFRNADILPETIFAWIFVPILAYMIIDMLYSYYSFKRRGPVNFDTYIWTFNKKSAPSAYGSGDDSNSGGSSAASCTDSACCVDGMHWDATTGKCALGAAVE